MRKLDRYILAEILGPLFLGFLVYTFILLIQVLFKSAELLIGSGVALSAVGRLLALSVPHILPLTIPMSLLFGILIGIGRLSTDSELVAIRASGVSLFSLFRPILLLSVVLTGINMWIMLDVMPQGNRELHRLQVDIMTQGLTEEIQPRVPHTGWQNKVLYIFEAPPGERRWRGVFMADTSPGTTDEVLVAERGETVTDENGRVVLRLEDASQHIVDLEDPTVYQAVSIGDYRRVLTPIVDGVRIDAKKGLRELRLHEIRRRIADPTTGELERNLAKVELHKRFSFPAACLVFGLLALPLGFSSARGGRSSGFAISIGIVLLYYVIFNTGEEAARDGTVEAWIAVWLPNVLFVVAGLVLLERKNRDKSLVLQHADRWLQSHFWGRLLLFKRQRERRKKARQLRRERAIADGRGPGRRRIGTPPAEGARRRILTLPELRWRFPNAIDRYVLRRWFGVLVLAGFSGLVLFLVADLTENIEDILKNDVGAGILVDYYRYKSFGVFFQISPIIVLVTTLLTFGLLSRTREITACKAAGISLFRLSAPVVAAAALVALLMGGMQSEILPASNSEMAQLHAVIKGRESMMRSPRSSTDRNWLFGQNDQLYHYTYYDPARAQLHGLQLFRFDEQYRLVGRLVARRATHVEGPWWILSGGWARTFDGTQETAFRVIDEPMKYRLGETPEYFQGGLTPPEEMNYGELASYIQELRAGGQDVTALDVQLHRKLAYPILSLVMALVALPFAFRLGRKGALYGVGISIVMGIVLVIVDGVFTALGEGAFLPPVIATWSPAAIFAIFSLYLFLGVRT